ncbi:hypothetical protein EUBVEN_01093 [Eubacterium ventriosum ATCC 27560]|uniref:Uncharacterized protein n=1 Tax=Eubacterium ventriosum ATCC 27560 TaxID=411463 RepID=A5Z5W1_9FIRM|nr:hypothetical protein EUBVEN_01093 [Eubacterium ventriosum ATCC 27560]
MMAFHLRHFSALFTFNIETILIFTLFYVLKASARLTFHAKLRYNTILLHFF